MNSLPERIMEYAEAKPIQMDDLLHLGDRTAVVRALSCLACSERMLRICQGVYMRPIQTRRGRAAPGKEPIKLPRSQARFGPSLAKTFFQPAALSGPAFPARMRGVPPANIRSKLPETLPFDPTDLRR